MNYLKDFGLGVVVIAAIVLVTQAFIYAPTLFGFSKEVGSYAFFTIMGVYFAWIFGGLTRSIYFNKTK